MYLVRFSASIDLSFAKSAASVSMTAEPGRDYVLSASQYAWMKTAPCASGIDRVSHLEARTRNFVVGPFGGRGRVLFYAGAGGYGDQLMAAPVVKFLADLGYEMTVLADPGNQTCWWHYPFVRAVITLPLLYETFKLYEHHALLEQVTNVDEHPDQQHPVDAMLYRLGVDPRAVEPARKSLPPTLSADELAGATAYAAGNRLAVYQMAGSAESRRLTTTASRNLFMRLAEAVPELAWLGVYDVHIGADYYAPLPTDAPRNARLVTFPSIRQLFGVASLAEVGVGTDSLLMHLMGSQGRPFVGLWGALPPELRTRYYPRHMALWNTTACPQAPCLRYKGNLERCPAAAQAAKMCLCLRDVDADQVASAVRSLIT